MIPEVQQTYIGRPEAAAYLTARGLKTTAQSLADRKHRGGGPRCAIVAGRALYTRAWLDEWLEREVARSSESQPTAA